MATPAGRISVLIAGNVYVKRALVRRFLEDDGYEVVGDVVDPEVVVPAILAGRPDAVLLDEDLTRQGLSIDQIRAASPDIRVVAFTAVTPGQGMPPVGADGYLTKGVGLSAVTSTLRRLFAEPFRPVLVGAAAGGAAAAAGLAAVGGSEAAPAPEAGHGRDWYRVLAVAAGFLLIIWGSVTAIDTTGTPGRDSVIVAEPPANETPGDLRQEAESALGSLLALLRAGGEDGAAIATAQRLREILEQARRDGVDLTDLEEAARDALEELVTTVPRETSLALARILPGLYPVVEGAPEPDVSPPTTVVVDVTDPGGDGGGGGNGDGNGGQNDPNEPDPNEPDPNEPDPNEPDPNEPGKPDHPEHPEHPQHPEHPDHPPHPQHPAHPDHPKGKDKDK